MRHYVIAVPLHYLCSMLRPAPHVMPDWISRGLQVRRWKVLQELQVRRSRPHACLWTHCMTP